MGLIKVPNEKPKSLAQDLESSTHTVSILEDHVTNRMEQSGNRIRWRNGQDSAAETRLWPRICGRNLAVEPAILSNGLDLGASSSEAYK